MTLGTDATLGLGVKAGTALFALLVGLGSSTAAARGPLRVGDVVGALTEWPAQPGLARIDLETEVTASIGYDKGWTYFEHGMAIKDAATVYTLREYVDGTINDRILQAVDVRDGKTVDLATLTPWDLAIDIAIEPAGTVLVYESGGGTIHRIDPSLGPDQVPSLVVSDPALQVYNYGQIFIDADGRIFVFNGIKVLRIDGSAVVDIWSGHSFQVNSYNISLDPPTGDLFVYNHLAGQVWRADPDVSLYSPTLIASGIPVQYQPGPAFVVTTEGDIVVATAAVSSGQSNGLIRYRASSATVETIPVTLNNTHFADLELLRAECSNGLDDDGDGLTDMADPHCDDASDNREVSGCTDGKDNDTRPGEASDGIDGADLDCACVDNNGDSVVDNPAACPSGVVDNDGELPECADHVDNDDDADSEYGGLDGPDDNCLDAWDESETPECSDGRDNDGDTFVDYQSYPAPGDPACANAEQDCEIAFGFCSSPFTACANGYDDDGDGFIDDQDPECHSLESPSEHPNCEDGIDNDGDGLVDYQSDNSGDPDCNDFTGHGELSECDDGIDNDGDGFADFGLDPGCSTLDDQHEEAECGDGIDNEPVPDGLIDLDDPDCTSLEDNAEDVRQCSDNVDNDGEPGVDFIDANGDGIADSGSDPDCRNPYDNTEDTRQCSDGIDNNGNNGTDYPNDPGCEDFDDDSECGLGAGQALLLLPFFWFGRRRRKWSTGRASQITLLGLCVCLSIGAMSSVAHAREGSGGEGSGQFTGLATAAEANLFSGSMSTSIPIALPQGRKNVTPSLNLTYSSGGGPGIFGYGWSLPLGTIERSTKYGRPRCTGNPNDNHTRDFVVMLSGGSLEVAFNEWENGQTTGLFRPLIDESYLEARLDTREPQHFARGNTWVVEDRAGMKYQFSTDRDNVKYDNARVYHNVDTLWTPLAAFPPYDCEFTSVWGLTQMEDPNGNTVDIRYFKEDNTLYPDEIFYGANPEAGLSEHPFKVKFIREARTYPIERSNRGVNETMRQVVKRIEIFYRPALGAAYVRMRAYNLTHTEHPNYPGRMLLTSVDDDALVAGDLLPEQTFTYATEGFDYVGTNWGKPAGLQGDYTRHTRSDNAHSLTLRSVMDMNADGISDLVVTDLVGSQWRVYPGQLSPSVGFSSQYFFWAGSSGRFIQDSGDNGGDGGSWTQSQVEQGIVDLTGDGIPDYVDARQGTFDTYCSGGQCGWTVFPGSCSSPTNCSFGVGMAWSSPAPFSQMQTRSGSGPGTETTTIQRLADVTGDGRPDLLWNGEVYVNDGAGFIQQWDQKISLSSITVAGQNGSSTTRTEVFDFNGDGLPDQLSDFGASLWLNTGRGLAPSIPLAIQNPPGMSGIRASNGGTHTDGSGLSDTYADFFDINGDGLPDRVYKNSPTASQWHVQLNQGGRSLAPAIPWPTSLGSIRSYIDNDLEGDGGLQSDSYAMIEIMDFNGDGFLDRVDASTPTWQIHLGKPATGPATKPLSLVRTDNGIGGFTTIEYGLAANFTHTHLPFNQWLVTEIRKGDGLSPEVVQSIEYYNGLFDSATREFRGFGLVWQADSDGNVREVTFGQGMFDKGKVLVSKQFVGHPLMGGQLLSQTSNVWQTRVPEVGWGFDKRDQVFLAEQKIEEFDTAGSTDPWGQSLNRCVFNRNEPPDDWGRITRTCSLPCTGAPITPGSCASPVAGQVDTVTVWANPATYSAVRERPASIETRGFSAPPAYDSLALKWFFYDIGSGQPTLPFGLADQGNVRQVLTVVGGGETPTVVTNTYDAFGNITSVLDPMGNLSSSTYNPQQFSLYPFSQSNALGHTVSTLTDLRYAKPIWVMGANNEISQFGYDSLGRVICEAKPGQVLPRPQGDPSGCDRNAPLTYNARQFHHRGDPASASFATADPDNPGKLSWVEVHALEPNEYNTGRLISRQYSDGLGRKRFSTNAQVLGAETTLSVVVSEHVEYGAGGRAVKSYVPYKYGGTFMQVPVISDEEVASGTVDYHLNGHATNIDPKGRAYKITLPDGSETLTRYEGRQTRVLKAQGTAHANETRAIEDDFGRVVRTESYVSTTPPTRVTYIDNTYDGMGRVETEVVNGDANTLVVHEYDMLGRETALTDPDSGTWESKYDANGNVLFRDDPEAGQHVQWLYDALGRITHVCTFDDDDYEPLSGNCGAPQAESTYFYDDTSNGNKAKGRLTSVNDSAGFEEFVYDQRGRVVEQTRTIGGSGTLLSGADPVSATMGFSYDELDRITEVEYPDGEQVSFKYNLAGQYIKTNSDLGHYVKDVDYDMQGQLVRLLHGNNVEDSREYFGADGNFRLKKIESVLASTGSGYLDLAYNYNPLHKIFTVYDGRNGGGPLSNTAIYSYDALGRLTNANLLGSGISEGFGHSPAGNMIEKGGEALTYGDPSHPHQVTLFDGKSFTYSDNGERLTKGAETYTYDKLGRLTHIDTAGGDSVDYVYDYTGRRAAKRVNAGSWTRYFSDAAESSIDDSGNGELIKYYFAGDTRVAMKKEATENFVDGTANALPLRIPPWCLVLLLCAVAGLLLGPGKRDIRLGVAVGPARAMGSTLLVLTMGPVLLVAGCPPENAPIEHYHADHVGSTQAVTDGFGMLVQQVRYTPYGEIRDRFNGAGALVSPNDNYRHEFTGYETELESGLQYAGARYFDPEVGQFLSHDPERQYASPYAYGPGDPINGTDPDGRLFGIDDAIIAVVIIVLSAIAAGVDAYRATGNWGDALKAAGMSIGMSIVSMGVFSIAGPVVEAGLGLVMKEATAALAVKIGMAGYGAYGAVQSARDGQYASALVGALTTGLAAYGIAKDGGAAGTADASDSPLLDEANTFVVADGGPLVSDQGSVTDQMLAGMAASRSDSADPQGILAAGERFAKNPSGAELWAAQPGPVSAPKPPIMLDPVTASWVMTFNLGIAAPMAMMGSGVVALGYEGAGFYVFTLPRAHTAMLVANEAAAILGAGRAKTAIGQIMKMTSGAFE